jgi:ribonuclease HII
MPDEEFLARINDSKKITEKRRVALYEELIAMSVGENPQVFFGL